MNKFIFLVFIIVLITACSSSKLWTGFYYSDKDSIGNESTWVIQEGFESIEQCREWIDDISLANDNYDYECGYDCHEQSGMNICERTER